MIKSMTGFGRCEVAEGQRRFVVEMKGVNHRYLDVNIRMPKKLNFFETAIRSLLKQSVQRGKVDIFITYEDLSESQVSLKYNETLAGEYLKAELPEIRLVSAKATYLLWIDCRSITENAEELAEYIRQKTGLYLCAGSEYGKAGEGFLRMNIACTKETMMEGLNRLKGGITQYTE